MMPESVLSRTFTVSLLLHAGIIGLLALEVSRRPIFSDTPLRVRILEPSGSEGTLPGLPQPPPAVEARPKAGRGPTEVPRASAQPANPQRPMLTERLAPRPISVPDTPPVPDRPVGPAPVPPAAAPSLPEPVAPRPEMITEAPRPVPAPTAPERSGLSLGGPSQGTPSLLGRKGSPPPVAAGPARPSLRDQIASLGSGLTEDVGGPAKRTVSLDSPEATFVDYLSRIKRRVQREWVYPEEAAKNGISGELHMVFTLNKAGSLIFISLVHSSGFPILDEEALRAVKVAAPFDAFPPKMGDEPLNISATFYYNLPRYLRRD